MSSHNFVSLTLLTAQCDGLTVAGEAGVGGQGAPHRAAIEEGEGGVREHGRVPARDEPAPGR